MVRVLVLMSSNVALATSRQPTRSGGWDPGTVAALRHDRHERGRVVPEGEER
jgi:hypothetical protein